VDVPGSFLESQQIGRAGGRYQYPTQPAYENKTPLTKPDRTNWILTGIGCVPEKETPDIVLVQGDTNTMPAGKADLVIGSRFLGETNGEPAHRQVGLKNS